MDIVVFTATELPIALRALARVHNSPRAHEFRAVLADLHRDLAPVDVPVEPAAIDLEDVAAAIVRPRARLRLVQLAEIVALVDGRPSRAVVREVERLADALGVPEPGLAVLRQVAAGRPRLARLLMTRRILARVLVDAWRADGLRGARRLLFPLLLGRGGEPEVAWRYRQLGLLPAGTLGRTLWAHCTERRFALPGEPGAIPEQIVFHDVGHLLTGFSTEPAGEIQQGAFQAGFVRRDGFAFLLFVVLQFHLGIKITPVAPPAVGNFDIPRVLAAVARGAACRDLSEHWQLWDDVARPLDEVRAAYGVAPL